MSRSRLPWFVAFPAVEEPFDDPTRPSLGFLRRGWGWGRRGVVQDGKMTGQFGRVVDRYSDKDSQDQYFRAVTA